MKGFFEFVKPKFNYMKYLIILSIILISCNNSKTLEDRVKNYMKDSVVTGFDDPKSYELVSIKIDTFKVKDYTQNIRQTLEITKSSSDSTELDSLLKVDQSRLIDYQIHVNFRSKNIMGALMNNEYNYRLDPQTNKLSEIPK